MRLPTMLTEAQPSSSAAASTALRSRRTSLVSPLSSVAVLRAAVEVFAEAEPGGVPVAAVSSAAGGSGAAPFFAAEVALAVVFAVERLALDLAVFAAAVLAPALEP